MGSPLIFAAYEARARARGHDRVFERLSVPLCDSRGHALALVLALQHVFLALAVVIELALEVDVPAVLRSEGAKADVAALIPDNVQWCLPLDGLDLRVAAASHCRCRVLDGNEHVLGLAGAVLPDARGQETARADEGGAGFAEPECSGEDWVGALESNFIGR